MSDEAARRALDALAHTNGYAIGPVQQRDGVWVEAECLDDAEEYRVEIFFRHDAIGAARIKAILAVLGREQEDDEDDEWLPIEEGLVTDDDAEEA